MTTKPIEGEKKVFLTGNEAVCWAALAAGAEIMYGYPITPQNEIMHCWSRIAPEYNRSFLQTEDELSAGFCCIGGILGGKKAFTGTAGPGSVLMQEPLSMAEMMRIPMVTIICQRGGPSTATVIYSQQETTLTCFGGNGEGYRIVYSTAGQQDLFDYTIKAFNTAWRYRFPTFILGDGYQSKMRETLTIYDPAVKGIQMANQEILMGGEGIPGKEREPIHLRNTYNLEEELFQVIKEMDEEYRRAAPMITEYQSYESHDAELMIISHGIVSRAVKGAVEQLRQKGLKVGYFRPITLRPFPGEALRRAVSKAVTILVAESAMGQLAALVKKELYGLTIPIEGYFRPGEGITVEEIVEEVQKKLE